jgi:glutamate racemase
MKIGVFDSGLGGLFTLKALTESLSQYDYVYLGDTKRVPYGSRSHETIYQFLVEGLEFLFSKDCALVIVACNTASAEALRRVQQEYLPSRHPQKKVLGMIVPLAEACAPYERVGVIGTEATVRSGAYPRECALRAPDATVHSVAAPLLVPLIENGELQHIPPILADYLAPFIAEPVDALVLACTHYPVIADIFATLLPTVVLIGQDTVIPAKTQEYLTRHSEIASRLSHGGTIALFVTDLTAHYSERAVEWFGPTASLTKVDLRESEGV